MRWIERSTESDGWRGGRESSGGRVDRVDAHSAVIIRILADGGGGGGGGGGGVCWCLVDGWKRSNFEATFVLFAL